MTMTLEELRESLDVGCLPNTDRPRWFAAIDAAIRERDDRWSKWQTEQCFLAKAESELAALKARIADAPRVYHSSFEYTLDASTLYARAVGIPGEETYALVKVED